MTGAQVLGPSYAAFLAHYQQAGSDTEKLGLKTRSCIEGTSIAGGSLTHWHQSMIIK